MKFWGSSSEETLVSKDVTAKLPAQVTTIPPAFTGRARTLVLCFDGTGDDVGVDNTNVVEIKDMLKDSKEEQVVYYQQGIGTYTPKIPGVRERVKIPGVTYISQFWDKAVAWSFDAHVIEAYLFIVDNYRDGDKICMFGFSRGSYTARAVAGMLCKVGLLPKEHREKAQAAFDSYADTKTKEAWQGSTAFQRTWKSVDVAVEFLGCWDTVNSVGYWSTRSLPFTASNPIVRHFRHAISMDERRAKFRTNLWSPYCKAAPGLRTTGLGDFEKMIRDFSQEKLKGFSPTDVNEVWFSGCHCDVGGGSVPNEIRPNLAHISLRWMIRQCFKQNTGIMFMTDKLEAFHLNPDTLYPVVQARPAAVNPKSNKIQPPIRQGPIDTVTGWMSYLNPFGATTGKLEPIPPVTNEEEADALDALAPIYDMLDIEPLKWLALENLWIKVYDPKLNKRVRKVFDKKPRSMRVPALVDVAARAAANARLKLHRTVLARMKAQHPDGRNYVPKALLESNRKPLSLLDLGPSGDHPQFDWVD